MSLSSGKESSDEGGDSIPTERETPEPTPTERPNEIVITIDTEEIQRQIERQIERQLAARRAGIIPDIPDMEGPQSSDAPTPSPARSPPVPVPSRAVLNAAGVPRDCHCQTCQSMRERSSALDEVLEGTCPHGGNPTFCFSCIVESSSPVVPRPAASVPDPRPVAAPAIAACRHGNDPSTCGAWSCRSASGRPRTISAREARVITQGPQLPPPSLYTPPMGPPSGVVVVQPDWMKNHPFLSCDACIATQACQVCGDSFRCKTHCSCTPRNRVNPESCSCIINCRRQCQQCQYVGGQNETSCLRHRRGY